MMSTNNHKSIAIWAAANGLLTIALAYIAYPRFGIYGVALATLCGDLLCGFFVYPRLAAKLVRMQCWKLYRQIVVPILIFFLFGYTIYWLLQLGERAGILAAILFSILAAYPTLRLAIGSNNFAYISGMIPRRPDKVAGL
jgi:hypothetical protein